MQGLPGDLIVNAIARRLHHVRGARTSAGILTWVERKQSAIMQDRIGANRASIFGIRVLGLLHPLADAIKMLTKEDFMPARADRLLFVLAPVRVGVLRAGRPSPPSRSATRSDRRPGDPAAGGDAQRGHPLRARHALAGRVRRS